MTVTGTREQRAERRTRLIRRLKEIELLTGELVAGLQPGLHHSLFRGRGIEFAEIREYTPGDDIRAIDWKVTARHDRPFVREYTEERDQTFYFLVDVSASGTFGSQVPKEEKILEILAALAFAALRNNDRIGLCLFSDRVETFLPARRGKRHLIALLNTVIDIIPKSKKTDPAPAIRFLGHSLSRRGTVVVISDFINTGPLAELRTLARRHEVIAIRVTDPREHGLPDIGWIVLEDPETGGQLPVDTSDPAFRQQFARAVEEQDRSIAAWFGRSGINSLSLLTTDPSTVPLRAFFRGMTRRRTNDRLL